MFADPAGELLDWPVITVGEHFVVCGEPVLGGQPGKCALHDPAPPEMFHTLHLPGQHLFDPLDEAALLAQFYHDAMHTVPSLMRLLWSALTRRVRQTTRSR